MSDSPPADRGHLLTEQRLDASASLDAMSIAQTLALINSEDAKVPTVVATAIPAIAPLVEAVVKAMTQGGRLIYLGAGTSGRLGVLDASECPPTYFTDPGQVIGIIAGGDSALRRSSEGAEDDVAGAYAELERIALNGGDVVVGIAAGGTTPYVLGALQYAHARGCITGLIRCAQPQSSYPHPPSPCHLINLPVGAEVVTGSTRMKAGTATKLVLNMITTTVMVQLGKTWGNLMVDLRATNAKLRDRAARILAGQSDVSREQALELIAQAGGQVKTALVMARLGVDAAEAHRLLQRHAGRLRPLLGPPR